MYNTPAIFMCDSYKLAHADMYPEGQSLLFSTWVPRSDKIARLSGRQLNADNSVVMFGVSVAIKKLVELYDVWFDRPTDEVLEEYADFIQAFLKVPATVEQLDRISSLHELGYLPIKFLYLPDGTVTKTGVVQLAVYNTHEDFSWLVNYIESAMSALLWSMQVNATIARNYRQECEYWAVLTCDNNLHVDWQCHDFCFRGKDSIEAGELNQMGHLLYFNGTDTLPALFAARNHYADFNIADYGSVPAAEHSVMCAGGEDSELETFERLIDFYKTGIVSIVSDTWNFWEVLTETLPTLKSKIMKRDGKVVIRPDSGDPVDIICGNPDAEPGSPEYKGAIELLWDVFGGEVNSKGYKVLDSHIGLIYGDSITLERARQIFERLAAKKFASSNVVLGIGSYTYQCNTRDTFGFAMKATGAVINEVEVALFKDPITDDGIKRSFRGFLNTFIDDDDNYYTVDGLTLDEAIDHPETAFIEFDPEFESVVCLEESWEIVKERARQAA